MNLLLAQNLIYLPTLGGANKVNRLLLEGLAEQGHVCRAISRSIGLQGAETQAQFRAELATRGIELSTASDEVDVFSHSGVEVHAVADGTQLRRYLQEQIQLFQPTWTLISSEDPGQTMLEAALQIQPSRVIYIVHTTSHLPFGPAAFVANPAKTSLIGQAASIIAVSTFLQEYIRRWSGLESAVLPLNTLTLRRGAFPRLGRFDADFVTFVNPCAVKGLPIFLALARAFPDVAFAAVPTWGTTEADRAALQQLQNVCILDPTDDIADIFARTRVLLVPSLWDEAFGRIVIEAMLHGIPVLASNIGGLPEAKLGIDYSLPVRQIEQYTPCFDARGLPIPIIPEQDIRPWVQALQSLLLDQERYDRLAQHSWEAAHRYLAQTPAITVVETFLQSLMPRQVPIPAHAPTPLQPVHPKLSAAERRRVLEDWNATAVAYPAAQVLHELVAAQVARTPEAIAVVFEDEQLTYAELDRRANQLAHCLNALGVRAETRVGICMERSLELVIGLLGILKAGGAYVPLDPGYPAERLAFMLQDARPSILLTQHHLVADLPAHDATLLCLDTDWRRIATVPTDPLINRATPDSIAYVIYTSGSTGVPKGAMNTHRGICNRLLWMQATYALTADDHVLQKTPFSFDVSVWEFFWPMLAGARLVMARPGGQRDRAYLCALIAQHAITTLHFVPSMLRVFLEEPGLGALVSLRRVICSGEELSADLQQRFFAQLDAELHNLYGPTEAAIDVTFWACEPRASDRVVPIGHPIANTQIYILDAAGQPVPIGEPGELYIGGAGLARGYLNRPDLTAEKFIPNPFASGGDKKTSRQGDKETEDTIGSSAFILAPSSFRLYKTGDMARYRADGAIEFLGRRDAQVKLRGFRVELGEIEALLSTHPAVRVCAVVLREDANDDKRLVAYVVPEDDRRWTMDDGRSSDPSSIVYRPSSVIPELRAFLAARLPEYMVPSTFVLLDTLPLTPNGKLDRAALPAPERASLVADPVLALPKDTLELQLLLLWEQSLGIKPLGVHDNFFALGGHSLQATYLMARIHQLYGISIPLDLLFERATVAHIASILRGQTALECWSPLVQLQTQGDQLPFFAVHARKGNVMCYANIVRYLGAEQPFYGLQAYGSLPGQQPLPSIEAMASVYIAAIQTVQPQGPYLLGGYSMGGFIAFEMAQQLRRRGHTVALLVLLDTAMRRESWQLDDASYWHWRYQDELALNWDALRSLSGDEQVEYIVEQLEASGDVPLDLRYLDRPKQRQTLKLEKRNVEALLKYTPQVYPGRVTLLRSSTERPDFGNDTTLGWGRLAAEGVEVYEIPAKHRDFLEHPVAERVAAILRQCIRDRTYAVGELCGIMRQ